MSRIARLLLVLPFLALSFLAAEPRLDRVRPSVNGSSCDAVLSGSTSTVAAKGSLVFSVYGAVMSRPE
jgi:hypothetical protein